MKKILYIALLLSLAVVSCQKQILDKTDLTGIDERIWSNETSATLYLNNLYSLIMPGFPSSFFSSSDESNTANNALLGGTLPEQAVGEFNANTYQNIRKINILLQELPKGSLSREAQVKIMSQAYFLRAFKYFELVSLYGGVPYVTFPQDWLADSLYVPRNKTSECIELIVKDLDSAALAPAVLVANQPTGDRGRITRYAALGMKGRVLLHWASAQFVGPATPPGDVAARWKRAYDANKFAYDEMIAGGHALFPTFSNVFLDETAANKELIMIRSYGITNNYNSFETSSRPTSMGQGGSYQPTWNLVKAFPMSDGTPISASPAYDSVFYYKNRDPRFYATVAYNGAVWPLGGQNNLRIWTYQNTTSELVSSSTGFYNKKFVKLSPTKDNAINGTADWIEMRLAEVMLNLAEAAAHTNNLTVAYDMLKALRERAGIANLNGAYGLKPDMTADEMIDAVIAERQIELAFEGKRFHDLRRTRRFTTQLNGTFRQTRNISANAPWLSSRVVNASNSHVNLNGTEAIPPALFIREEADLNTKGALATTTIANGSIATVMAGTGENAGLGFTSPPRVTVGNPWLPSFNYTLNQQVFYGPNLYTVSRAGRTSTIPPTHISGAMSSGSAELTYAGKVATLRALIGANGTVTGYDIINPGFGYNAPPNVVTQGYNTYFTATIGLMNPQINFLDKYYFFDIPRDNINKNPRIEQNPGWGGNFNVYE